MRVKISDTLISVVKQRDAVNTKDDIGQSESNSQGKITGKLDNKQ